MLEVIPCGADVLIDGLVEAKVLQIIVNYANVEYRLEWWNMNYRAETVFHSSRVKTKVDKIKIGFKA